MSYKDKFCRTCHKYKDDKCYDNPKSIQREDPDNTACKYYNKPAMKDKRTA